MLGLVHVGGKQKKPSMPTLAFVLAFLFFLVGFILRIMLCCIFVFSSRTVFNGVCATPTVVVYVSILIFLHFVLLVILLCGIFVFSLYRH